ncbi:MAG: DMT family transporter [candidate division Zixibacteria bacterium]|nr:DMT family transporter [candidate division Zixibacteria bacterium]
MKMTGLQSPIARGVILALGSAMFFGASTPLLRYWGGGIGPWSSAALLYTGAALAGALFGGLRNESGKLGKSLSMRLWGAAICGAALAPAALAWGVQRTSAVSSSLMLNIEAVLTIGLAWLFYREHVSRRVASAAAIIVIGGAILVLDRSEVGAAAVWGLLGVALATVLWALDNTISRPLADRDTAMVVFRKSLIGVAISVCTSVIVGERFPQWTSAIALVLIGMFGYGVSLRLYLLSQRRIGVARTASVFAAGPFLGAALAVAMGERSFTLWGLSGGFLILLGVVLHVTEMHEHPHTHEAIEHEHAHHHADGHHEHEHPDLVVGEHTHRHFHEGGSHTHSHAPDVHHLHDHR